MVVLHMQLGTGLRDMGPCIHMAGAAAPSLLVWPCLPAPSPPVHNAGVPKIPTSLVGCVSPTAPRVLQQRAALACAGQPGGDGQRQQRAGQGWDVWLAEGIGGTAVA